MTVRTRRVWRVASSTLAGVWVFVVVAGLGVPTLAVLAYLTSGDVAISVFLVVLAAAAVVYGWRFGLYPRLIATAEGIETVNPGRRVKIGWDELTVIAPGENGLVLGTEEARTEVWCIQKSRSAMKRGRTTRADRIVAELESLQDRFDPPLEDDETGLRIRRARQSECDLLTQLERSANEASFARVVDSTVHGYPTEDARRRWRRLLRDRRVHVRVLEEFREPVGLVAWDGRGQLRQLAVSPRYANHGYGSLLLQFVTEELIAAGPAELWLWVLEDDLPARGFYRSRGWRDTEERSDSAYPPHPVEIKMVRTNPSAPRRRA
ncbi:MAG: GNAT family N-acetyltransferase [Microlunatus sp.]|nr:GNAT family N-acetyltransferase [Microlunatus sp.]MDN5770025.1 GNAT family N-acetyltransferase [Microlunatus sp.]MDN5803290.1 GNAT family N-acetyltransferase [Microlunatus sp.]